MGIDDRRHGIGRIMKTIDEFERQGGEQCHPKEQEGSDRRAWRALKVGHEVRDRVDRANEEHEGEDGQANLSWASTYFCFKSVGRYRCSHNASLLWLMERTWPRVTGHDHMTRDNTR